MQNSYLSLHLNFISSEAELMTILHIIIIAFCVEAVFLRTPEIGLILKKACF